MILNHRVWVGNNFSQVCMSVCLSVQAVTAVTEAEARNFILSTSIHLYDI